MDILCTSAVDLYTEGPKEQCNAKFKTPEQS